MTNWVTVKVPEDDRDTAKAERPDGATYGDCLVAGARELADGPDFTATASIRPTVDEDALTAIREQIENTVADAYAADFPTADVKEAVREVLREELPEGALR